MMQNSISEAVSALTSEWQKERWRGVVRPYSPEEVLALRPSVMVEHTWARRGSERLWAALQKPGYVGALGTLTGAQAVQMAKAGLQAIYLSGWQVAADMNQAGQTYPDQSLYPCNSVPTVVRRLNQALTRADQVSRNQKDSGMDWYLPIVADAEAGFGGPLHAFELMKAMIEAGAAAVHFEDQLAAEKKCGHLGGKVLIPTANAVRQLTAARLAADVLGVPTLIVARTDSLSATYITSDIDESDRPFIQGVRTPEGYHAIQGGMDMAIARGLAFAPLADLVWFETSQPDLGEAREFAAEIHRSHPGKLLAYNCSPSFHWEKKLEPEAIAAFSTSLGDLGYRFQFITLAGWHLINFHTLELARQYACRGMPAYVDLQRAEFSAELEGYSATRHQTEVGTGYFDQVLMTVTAGCASTAALRGSTEAQQFSSLRTAGLPTVSAPTVDSSG